ncbi:MAG: hypothetical protein AAGB24_05740 [Bacteroidota bacterium]
MYIQEKDITVFFFGSPGDGFSSFPKEYVKLVKSLDTGKSTQPEMCIYTEINKKTVIRYVEYNLTGIGNTGNVRGGRNFGLYISIEGYEISSNGRDKILDYVRNFIAQGIVDNEYIFKRNSNPKYYIISSFSTISGTLKQLIARFVEHFLIDFKDYLIPISNQRKEKSIDLIPDAGKRTVEKKPIQNFRTHKREEEYDKVDILNEEDSVSEKKGNNILHLVLLGTILILNVLILIKDGFVGKNENEGITVNKSDGEEKLTFEGKTLTIEQIKELNFEQLQNLTLEQKKRIIKQQFSELKVNGIDRKTEEKLLENTGIKGEESLIIAMAIHIEKLNKEKKEKIQKLIGVEVDGDWGDDSKNAFIEYMKGK